MLMWDQDHFLLLSSFVKHHFTCRRKKTRNLPSCLHVVLACTNFYTIPDCPRRWRPIHNGLFEQTFITVPITLRIEDFRLCTARERSCKTANQCQLLKSLFCLAEWLWVALLRYVSISYTTMFTLMLLINKVYWLIIIVFLCKIRLLATPSSSHCRLS